MLQEHAVTPATLGLLKQLSSLDKLTDFGLGGGTNVALRLGHRLSVDLDFFTNVPFETSYVFQLITKQFPTSELLFEKNQTMMFVINDIKVDFVLYPFPWLKPFEQEDGIKLISLDDLIPMKLQAAGNRNAKKDYWDIATLLPTYSLEEMLMIFKKKFPTIDTGYIIHSLTDFEQADTQIDPDVFSTMTWSRIKETLHLAVKNYTRGLL